MESDRPIYANTSRALTPELRKARLAALPQHIIPANLSKRAKSFTVPEDLSKIVVNLARAHYYVFSLPDRERLIDWREESGVTAKEAWELVMAALRRHYV